MSVPVRAAAVALAFGFVLAGAGCSTAAPNSGQSGGAPSNSPASGSTAPVSTDTAARWTADAITQAFAAINQKVGAEPADYIKVLLGPVKATVEAINPQKRQNVDQYEYRGSGVEVTPVDVSSSDPGAVDESAFTSDTVKPDVLVAVMTSAVKDSRLDDVKVDTVAIKKFSADDPAPVIEVFVKGPRGSTGVRYDINGQFQQIG